MGFHSSLASWKSGRSLRPRPQPPRRGTRLVLEHLEDRSLPSSYTAGSVHDLIADINAANAAGGSNTIQLTAAPTAPYVLSKLDNTTDGPTGLPVIAANDNLTIVGNGDTIARSTKSKTPVFRLLAVASGGSLTLENLTLQGGLAYGISVGGVLSVNGGAIYSQGNLVLNGVTVQGNTAEGFDSSYSTPINARGGGILSDGGSVTLEGGTIVQNNQAIGSSVNSQQPIQAGNAYGGGLCAIGGTVTVTNATVASNSAIGGEGESAGLYGIPSQNGYGFGGGLYLEGATVTVANATVVSNVATFSLSPWGLGHAGTGGGGIGGGMYLVTRDTATLTNCTVQGNSAAPPSGVGFFSGGSYAGGGLFINGGTTVYLDSFTVAHTIDNNAGDINGVYILL
jgi:hypothetical protein